MLVGAARITLDFYNNDKVSVKQRELEKLCKELRRKFNVSALEIAEFDDPEKCVIGFAAVIPENWNTSSAKSFMDKVCKTIDETSVARVVDEDWDLLAHEPA
jgi:uncharacterized protein YlxP (DUF503 family)